MCVPALHADRHELCQLVMLCVSEDALMAVHMTAGRAAVCGDSQGFRPDQQTPLHAGPPCLA